MLDGKTLNVSSSQADGEVNLFGFEDKPTFNDNRDKLQRGQVLIKDIDDILMNLQRRDKIYISEIHSEQNLLKSQLKALIHLAGNSIQDLRKTKVKKKTFALEKFKKFAGSDWSASKFTFVVTAIQTSIFQLNGEVNTLLKVVDLACFCLSFLNHHGDDYVAGKEVLLQYQHNYICLSGIEQLLENVNERKLFRLVRQ